MSVALLNTAGVIVAGPLHLSTTPANGVVFKNNSGYHGNLSTAGVAAGSYQLRVRFDSPRLVDDLLLGLDLS